MSTNGCFLCKMELPKNPVGEENKFFCCSGCLVVYQILSSQEKVEDYKTHPLYHQALRSGVISNPKLLEEIDQKSIEVETQTLRLEITQMWCPSCCVAIRLILMKEKGVSRCLVDYATDIAVIEYAPRYVSKERILKLIERMGYQPHFLFSPERTKVSKKLWVRFSIASFCTLNLMMFAIPLYTTARTEGYETTLGWLSFLLSIPLISYAGWPIWRRFRTSLRTGLFGMETLVLVGVLSAFSYSTLHLLQHAVNQLYYDSMGMVITAVLLGKILESRAKFSAKESLICLSRSFPKKGCKRLASGKWTYVPLQEIVLGDHLRAQRGEKIVLDGRVETGEALVDESVITGEVIGVQKKRGSRVVSGSMVKQGTLHYRVTANVEESLFSKIVYLAQSGFVQKEKGHRLIDRITTLFVPTVLLLALFSLSFGGILRAISVLLISCPCAIGIATPLAESFLLKRFIQEGALVRNRKALSKLSKKILFVFDKTGTLTVGHFRVHKGLEELDSEQLSILKSLVSPSTHPISVAIDEVISTPCVKLEAIQEIVSKGMEGVYQKCRYLLGSREFLEERGVDVPDHLQNSFESIVYFASGARALAKIHLGDTFRKNIPRVAGVVLSGDHPSLVSQIAEKYGFKWGKGGCDPLQKRREIEKLKEKKRVVVMVGDGVNDAPALTAADVGVSMASATDISREVSDILLTKDSLDTLPRLCLFAKKGEGVIAQNLFWAFFYNILGIGLALAGVLTPLFSACAMILSSFFVILNSLRLR